MEITVAKWKFLRYNMRKEVLKGCEWHDIRRIEEEKERIWVYK